MINHVRATLPNGESRPPDKCVNIGFNMWGEWYGHDGNCLCHGYTTETRCEGPVTICQKRCVDRV
jgi:hypothetical protein